MRKYSRRNKTARLALGVLWLIVIILVVRQLLVGTVAVTDGTSSPSGAATGSQLLNDVQSGQDLQGSSLPLDVSSPQETAKPN